MERRQEPRSPCRTVIRVSPDDDPNIGWFFLDSTDVSAEGLFLETDLLFGVGEELDLEIEVPGRALPVRRRARVMRVVNDLSGACGVGVQLLAMTDEERGALARMNTDLVRNRHSASAV